VDLSAKAERIVIYTALAGGGRDAIVDPAPIPGVDYVCFTDQPLTSKIWQIRPFNWIHPREAVRTAKHPKVLPHLYFPGHDLSLWVDGNITPGPDVKTLADMYLQRHALALHRHPRRACPYKEAAVVAQEQKDHRELIFTTGQRIRKAGLPPNNGLWECGILFRRHHDPVVKEAMKLWWQEIEVGTQSDQIAMAFVLWKTGLSFRSIDGNLRESPFFSFQSHEEIYWGKKKEKNIKPAAINQASAPCL
jgi:hypothetical protein